MVDVDYISQISMDTVSPAEYLGLGPSIPLDESILGPATTPGERKTNYAHY